MTKKEEKQFLRQTMKRLEQELSAKYKRNSARAICAHVTAMPEYQAAETVFCFVGTENEIDTRPILQDVLRSGKRLCVPLCTEKGIMDLRQIFSLDDLHPGSFGISEPSPEASPQISVDDVDFAIVPCLTCNHLGQRLGKGGGYYDRFLSHYRSGTVLLCREKLIREEIPVEPHDYPIPWVLTETGLYEDGTPARLY